MDIVKAVGTFKVKHLPNEELRVRIGNHTGSCCAGKLPGYHNMQSRGFLLRR